jgi:integrase
MSYAANTWRSLLNPLTSIGSANISPLSKPCPLRLSSAQKLELFFTNLARHRDLSANSQNQALNAVLYFYKEVLRQPLQGVDALRAKRPARLRHAPTVAETQALLQNIRDRACYPTNLIARLIYGCGLRVTEPQGWNNS